MLQATSHFHYCVIDGQVVGLDLHRARYFFVRGQSAAALLALESTDASQNPRSNEDAFRDLLRLGYVTRASSGSRPLRSCNASLASARINHSRGQSRNTDTLQLFWRLVAMRMRIATGSLNHVLHPIRKLADRREVRDIEVLKERLGRFAASRPSISLPRSCLLDSAVLYLFLGDPSVDLVFAVSLTPFAAHCWLERDGYLLNDEPDYVRRFTPIMRFRP